MPKGHLRAGDVLINKDGAQTGKVGYYDGCFEQAAVNEHLFILRSIDGSIDQKLLYYYLLFPETQRRIAQRITGSAQPGLNSQFVDAVTLLVPNRAPEQHRIAEILSTLDEAIEQTEALIAKTQQIKIGLIHDLFTRGVAPDGQLRPPRETAPQLYKESPLGWIPKEWAAVTFGSCLIDNPQNGLYKPATFYGDEGIPIVRIDSFYEGIVSSILQLKRVRLSPHEARLYSLSRGEILVNRVNSIDYVGKSAIVPDLAEEVVFESNMMRCRINRAKLLPEFAIRWLCATYASSYFHSRAKSAIAQASINQADVKGLPVVRPGLDEQEHIVARMDCVDERLKVESGHVAKLRQLKSGLMHDLLTGAARVPLAAPVPEAAHV